MPLGYCTHCHQLKNIRPVGQHWGTREVDWAPVIHNHLVHVECGELVASDEETSTGTFRYTCVKHGLIFVDHIELKQCPGIGKPIK